MSNNDSSAITTMHTTLISIQRIRTLLAQESRNMSTEVYKEVDNYLGALESGLSQEMAQYEAYKYTQAPHLYEDDEDENANLWRSLVAWAGQKR